MHATGFAPSVITALPLGPLEIFAKAGYYYYKVKLTVNVQRLGGASVE